MTLAEFISKYNNKGIDYDGAYGFQCMDVYRQYTKEVVQGKQSPPVAGAKDVWDTYLSEVYTRTANKPDNSPKPGDVVIWGTQLGQYGHIAICTEADTNSFISFDQNYPIGSVCHLQKHTYVGVLGWLHPKGLPTPPVTPPEPPIDPDKVKIDLGPELGVWEVQKIKSELRDLRKMVEVEKQARIAATKENSDLLDWFWEKLNPVGKDKNWPNVKGEVEGLLHVEETTEPQSNPLGELISALLSVFKRK